MCALLGWASDGRWLHDTNSSIVFSTFLTYSCQSLFGKGALTPCPIWSSLSRPPSKKDLHFDALFWVVIPHSINTMNCITQKVILTSWKDIPWEWLNMLGRPYQWRPHVWEFYSGSNSYWVHPCEKVIGIFFRHNFLSFIFCSLF